MNDDIKKWLEEDGERFIKDIGIKKGHIVLDFGCGEGHYTIPAAKVVGREGKVYSFDKDKGALRKLEETVRRGGLRNIELINGDTKVSLRDDSLDVVLVYDVIHYEKNRKGIYEEIYRLLKPAGFLSLYPKHYREDYPLMELASLGLKGVIKEVEAAGIVLRDRFFKKCLHNGYYNECQILNFEKLSMSNPYLKYVERNTI